MGAIENKGDRDREGTSERRERERQERASQIDEEHTFDIMPKFTPND